MDATLEGNTVVVRHTARGTHQDVLLSIPPTGKQVTLSGIAILRFTNGICIEEWFNGDELGLLRQLGVAPMMG